MICASAAEKLHFSQFTPGIIRQKGFVHYLFLALRIHMVTFMQCSGNLPFAG